MINKNDISIKFNENLQDYCTFKIGGPVKYLIFVYSCNSLIKVCKHLQLHNIKYKIIGMGANILFDSNGYNGAIVVNKSSEIKFNNTKIIADSGVNLTSLIMQAYNHGLSGLENLSGIPSTLGGGVVNNVGAFGTEIAECVEYVECYDNHFNRFVLDNKNCRFEYRNSVFKHKNLIVTKVYLNLEKENKSLIKQKIHNAIQQKTSTQPINYPSAGSVFKRCEITPAKIIDELGLKGTRIGGAEISTKHAGFIINKDSATSNDVKTLINLIKQKIKNATGIELDEEIELIE